MSKQTTVKWLLEQLSSSKYFYNLMEEIESRGTVAQSNIFEQAKAMHKEEIRNAYDKGEFNQGCNGDSEQYYNEIFKKK